MPSRSRPPLVLAALLAAVAGSVPAAEFRLTRAEDGPDAAPGDGACEVTPGLGDCSFRAAVEESEALAGPDSIALPAGDWSSGPVVVLDDLEVRGEGSETSALRFGGGCGAPLVLHRPSGIATTMRLEALRVTGGRVEAEGGRLEARAALLEIELRLRGDAAAVLEGVRATARIGLSGRASLDASELDHQGEACPFRIGLQVTEEASVLLRRSLLSSQAGEPFGAPLDVSGGTVRLIECSIAGNRANGLGPCTTGLKVSGGEVELIRSEIRDNRVESFERIAAAEGVAACIDGGEVRFVDSTITGNEYQCLGRACPEWGQIVFVRGGRVSFSSSTIARNVGSMGANQDLAWLRGVGLTVFTPAEVHVDGLLLAENLPGARNCLGELAVEGPLMSDGLANCTVRGDPSLVSEVADARLRELPHPRSAWRLSRWPLGIELRAWAPQAGSPAIDAGGLWAGADLRGVPRPLGAAREIGAVEACDGLDSDGDLVPDDCDSCPDSRDPAQQDCDGDGLGDACTPGDLDGDGLDNSEDPCPCLADGSALDSDEDGVGDGCDSCPFDHDPSQADVDGDGVGDICDNCRLVPNPAQQDSDGDFTGDDCEFGWADVAPPGAPDGELTIGDVVRLLRLASGVDAPTPDEERRADIAPAVPSRWEPGRLMPDPDRLRGLDVGDVVLALRVSVGLEELASSR